jgi:hypothetical protein
MGGESRGVGERDDDDLGVTEPVEVFAHGEHVFLAGESSEVTVEDRDERPPLDAPRCPGRSGVIDQLQRRKRVTDPEDAGHEVPSPSRSRTSLASRFGATLTYDVSTHSATSVQSTADASSSRRTETQPCLPSP